MKLISALLFTSLATAPIGVAFAQEAAPAQAPASVTVIGTVTEIDIETATITVKSDTGESVAFPYNEKSAFKKLPPGKTMMTDAVSVALTEIEVGDRVTAKKRMTPEGKIAPITLMIMMSKGDIAKKQELEREAWRTRGVVGTVGAVDAAARTVTLNLRTRGEAVAVKLVTGDKTVFRRYQPESVKFSDAKTSAIGEIKPGDQLRALGNRSEDGATYTAEQVVFGTFKTITVTIEAVDAEKKEIKVKQAEGGPLTLMVSPDANLRQFPSQMGAMFGGGGGQGGGERPSGPPPGQGGPGGPGGQGRPGGPRGFDPAAMIDRLPPMQLADLKPGGMLLVLTTVGNDPARANAITVVSGIEVFAAMMQQRGGGRGGGGAGGGGGFGGFELGIGLP
jgi:co-chaperonin GroES (HSP10)